MTKEREELLLTEPGAREALANSPQRQNPFIDNWEIIAEALLDKILKPEWKDKPDSEGWWWWQDGKYTEIRRFTVEDLKPAKWRVTFGQWRGKWSKAIVPEIEG